MLNGNEEPQRMWKKTDVTWFNILSQQMSGWTKEK